MLSTNRFRSITLQCLHQEFFVRAGKNRDNWKALRSVKEIRQCLFLFKRCKEFWNIAFTANKTRLRLINCNSAAGYILLGTQHFLVFQHLVSDHIVSSATSYLFRVILYDAGVQIKTSHFNQVFRRFRYFMAKKSYISQPWFWILLALLLNPIIFIPILLKSNPHKLGE